MPSRLRIIESLSGIPADDWNALQSSGDADLAYPFTRHEFLHALEATGCVDEATGWQPHHVLLESEDGTLEAAAPCYLKFNSYGEFVFDFSWAHAYRQTGMPYYPKLVCAVPYSPVVGPRLFARNDQAHKQLCEQLSALAEHSGASSLHMLFGRPRDHSQLEACGALLRRDCQYHWHNRDYENFDDFLNALPSKRRKEIRRERRRVRETGIGIEVLSPSDIDDSLLQRLYLFYSRTYLVRGQRPYLSLDFFRMIGQQLPNQVLFFVAYQNDEPVAMAFMLRDASTLYGRHWGCLEDHHSLHFETCYYAGIEYCINNGLQKFDAGAQGEHKLRRGFEPVATWSAHIVRHPGMRAAVADFVQREAAMVEGYHAQARSDCAFEQPFDNTAELAR